MRLRMHARTAKANLSIRSLGKPKSPLLLRCCGQLHKPFEERSWARQSRRPTAGNEEGTMAEAQDQGSVMRIGRRCFVSNLNWKTSWQDLKDKFRECGEVVYANVVRDEDGRSKGWGIVEYDTPEAAVQAVTTFNGTELAGRKILVREDREDRDVKQYNRENGIEPPEREARPPRRERRPGGPRDDRPPRGERRESASTGLQVVVQGIPWKYTDDDLKQLFEEVGEIAQAEVQVGKDGRSRGYGTVRFSSAEAAQTAIEKVHSTELEGRTLTVKLDRFA